MAPGNSDLDAERIIRRLTEFGEGESLTPLNMRLTGFNLGAVNYFTRVKWESSSKVRKQRKL